MSLVTPLLFGCMLVMFCALVYSCARMHADTLETQATIARLLERRTLLEPVPDVETGAVHVQQLAPV